MKLLAAICASCALLTGAAAAAAATTVPDGHVLRHTVFKSGQDTLRLSVVASHGKPELLIEQATATRTGNHWLRTDHLTLPERVTTGTANRLMHLVVNHQGADGVHVEITWQHADGGEMTYVYTGAPHHVHYDHAHVDASCGG
jgi:opacity protein-like surface antigen